MEDGRALQFPKKEKKWTTSPKKKRVPFLLSAGKRKGAITMGRRCLREKNRKRIFYAPSLRPTQRTPSRQKTGLFSTKKVLQFPVRETLGQYLNLKSWTVVRAKLDSKQSVLPFRRGRPAIPTGRRSSSVWPRVPGGVVPWNNKYKF